MDAVSSGIVYTVWRSDDQTTHLFSTPHRAKEFADTLECPVVHSEYLIDYPERFYGATQ